MKRVKALRDIQMKFMLLSAIGRGNDGGVCSLAVAAIRMAARVVSSTRFTCGMDNDAVEVLDPSAWLGRRR